MLKKILYILASFILGFILITTVITINLYSVLQSNIVKAIDSKNYLEVSKYFSGIFDYENKFETEENFTDGVHVDIYYSLFDGQRTVAGENNENVTYATVETGIQVMIYHLPEDFKLEDTETVKGGVSIVFDNEEEIFFPFYISENQNYYQYVGSYKVIPFSITYVDYVAAVEKADTLTTDSVIKAVKISDSAEKEYTITTTGLTFNNALHNSFSTVLDEYNTLQKDAALGKEISSDAKTTITNQYNAVVEANPHYSVHYTDSVIYGSAEFLVPVIIAVVIFLALDIFVGWLIFRKKKVVSKYIPMYQQKAKTPHEPEQFNRNVFNVEDYDAEETTETKEIVESIETKEVVETAKAEEVVESTDTKKDE